MPASEQQQQQQQQQPSFTFDDLVLACQESDNRKAVSKMKQVLKALQRLQDIKNELIEEEMPKFPCLICLNEFRSLSKGDCCDHTFCFECIDMWTEKNTKCPVCRKEIEMIFYDFKDGKYSRTRYLRDYDPSYESPFIFYEYTGILNF